MFHFSGNNNITFGKQTLTLIDQFGFYVIYITTVFGFNLNNLQFEYSLNLN